MMRVTPFRLITLQCSQIGFTLLRTFTGAPGKNSNQVIKHNVLRHLLQGALGHRAGNASQLLCAVAKRELAPPLPTSLMRARGSSIVLTLDHRRHLRFRSDAHGHDTR